MDVNSGEPIDHKVIDLQVPIKPIAAEKSMEESNSQRQQIPLVATREDGGNKLEPHGRVNKIDDVGQKRKLPDVVLKYAFVTKLCICESKYSATSLVWLIFHQSNEVIYYQRILEPVARQRCQHWFRHILRFEYHLHVANLQLKIWDPGIKSAFRDNTLRARWF